MPLPLAADSERWRSVFAERTVLAVAHNVTSATRLLDLLALFEGDRRVETVFTCTGSSAMDNGTAELFQARGALFVPWSEAIRRKFDLAIATSRGGDLFNLHAPLICTPHGAGYNKVLDGGPGAFGLTEQSLMHDGRVVPSAIVLSHEEQRARLAVSCPDAVPVSRVAGDPCFDELVASRPFRQDYRHALGLRRGQRLVVVSSTWGRDSVLDAAGPERDTLRRALAELPADAHRVVALVHPNAYYGHGAWQLHTWLAPLLARGLMLPRPDAETWKAALVAADSLCGDGGSVTQYGVSLGVPTVLGSFAADRAAAGSPMALLAEVLPRLSAHRPLLAQLRDADRRQCDDPGLGRLRSLVTSCPGQAAARLRALFYERLALPEPAAPTGVRTVPVPVAEAVSGQPAPGRSPVVPPMYVTVGAEGGPLTVSRYHAALQRPSQEEHLAGAHLVADIDDPDTQWPRAADVLLVRLRPGDGPVGTAGRAEREADAGGYPGCSLIATETPDDGCVALLPRLGVRVSARWSGPRPWWVSAAFAASVLYDRLLCLPPDDPDADGSDQRLSRFSVTIGADAEPALLVVTAL
ncbi:hypothetical protein [Streptomyces sp. CA-111067]|uniref:hypothetical protein n=1 Tax=Streptomyces sp. CA-111067 TaxID=3240046 RepID=UPI003D96454F